MWNGKSLGHNGLEGEEQINKCNRIHNFYGAPEGWVWIRGRCRRPKWIRGLGATPGGRRARPPEAAVRSSAPWRELLAAGGRPGEDSGSPGAGVLSCGRCGCGGQAPARFPSLPHHPHSAAPACVQLRVSASAMLSKGGPAHWDGGS